MVIHTNQQPPASKRARTSESRGDRVTYALAAAIAIVLIGLVVQTRMLHGNSATNAVHPSLNTDGSILASNAQVSAETETPMVHGALATPEATATPTITPEPGAADRAAWQIWLLQRSWDARDWPGAINHLGQITALDSDYPGLQRAWCDTYLHWADELETACQIQQATSLYRQAILYCEDRGSVLESKDLALRYLSGKWRYEHGLWSQAASVLHTVYETDPDYAAGCEAPSTTAQDAQAVSTLDVRSLLYASYLASSQEFLEQGQIQDAHKAAQTALELAPDRQQAAGLLREIRERLTPTPSPPADNWDAESKRIEVSISKQRMYIWQGDQLLYEWVCSTGGPGSGTATGQYKVQSKIPEAWASQWSLRMPYWLGIYNVGTMENGIHALPILSNGRTLWAGYLGTPVSYGCIILSTENARTLYQWADIGTPVWIYR